MGYALLIVEKPGDRAARTEAEGRGLYDSMVNVSEYLRRRGLLTMSQSLVTEAAGARVSKQEQKFVVRDGPFAESREMIGGFFLLTCNTREDALAIAHECPAINWATIEV